jgi:hypothetical protein
MKAQIKQFTLVAGALAALVPAIAAAQSLAETRDLLSPYGEYFLIGGGVTNYFDHAVKDRVDTGGTWDVRLGLGSRSFVGGELAYIGSARNAGDLGNKLVTNGGEAVLRLQYPYEQGRWRVEPFAFGGAGWAHFSLNSPTRSGLTVQDTNDLFVMPVGGGLTLAYDHILFDTRFTYRQTFDENLIRTADGTAAASLKSWAVTASLGYEF